MRGRKSTQEEIIAEFIKRHGDRYGYETVDYKGTHIKVTIKCKEKGHGFFEQTPNHHLRGNGCPMCADLLNALNQTFTKENVLRRFREVQGNKYEYEEVDYKGDKIKVKIRCKKERHGFFEQTPSNHLRGNGCPVCFHDKKKSTQEDVIRRFRKEHGDKYKYEEVDYINGQTKVKIRCKKHGIFEQQPGMHLQGRGCFVCFKESVSFWLGKWRKMGNLKNIEAMPDEMKNKSCYFYCFRVTGEEGVFYKIGVSVRTKTRGREIERASKEGYKVNILYEWKETLYESLKREIELKEKYQEFRYTPKIKFGGCTECFSVNVLELDLKEGWTMMCENY